MQTLDDPIPVTVDPPGVLARLGAKPRPAMLLLIGLGCARVRYTDQLREIVTTPTARIHMQEND